MEYQNCDACGNTTLEADLTACDTCQDEICIDCRAENGTSCVKCAGAADAGTFKCEVCDGIEDIDMKMECPHCGKSVCVDCIVKIDKYLICNSCRARQVQPGKQEG